MALNMSTGFVTALLGAQSFEQIMRDGAIEIRSGTQPVTADQPATGTLLARITRDGGAWTAGQPANGLRWFQSGRFMFKAPDQNWTMTGLAAGTAAWFRILGNAVDAAGFSLEAPRIDGAIGLIPEGDEPPVGDAQLYLPTLSIAPAGITKIGDAFWFTFPPLE